MGKPIQERLTPESFQTIKIMLEKELATIKIGKSPVKSAEIELLHKNGSTYWVEIRARLLNEANKPLKIMGITRDITRRKISELKQKELINELEKTLAEKAQLLKEVNTLRRLLPICSGCKRIRDENGKWWPFDAYVAKVTEAKLTHTICLDCEDAFYGDQEWYIKQKK